MGVARFEASSRLALLAALMLAGCLGARADDGGDADDDDEPKAAKNYEGAIGLVFNYGAAFPGSSDLGLKVQPGGFLRWDRITITGAGGFTTRRNDDVERGLAAEVLRRRTWRMSLGLRYDDGRGESDSDDLAGMGSIPQTMRGRISFRWDPVPEWRFGLGSSFDLLNRVGGITVDAGISRRWFFGQDRFFALSATFGLADQKYMQAWHGVTAEQSANSGYAPYTPQGGLRNLGLGAIWREEINDRWTGFVGASAGRLLGPAADSPLTRKVTGAGVQAGIAWRF